MGKKLLKNTTKLVMKFLALPIVALYYVLNLFCDRDSSFHSIFQLICLIPGKTGIYYRSAFLSIICLKCSDEISVGFMTLMSHRNTTIETGVYIGPQSNIGMCKIGRNTLIGSNVHILSGNKQHAFNDLNKPIQEQEGSFIKIEIGEDCWLGNGSIIMASIADQTIVAAGAVVTKPIEIPMGIYAGNPAKRIKER